MYSQREKREIESIARKFKRRNFFRLPALWRGNKVASRNPESKIRNFSTITGVFRLSSGKWVYLVYSYPLSLIHRILDGIGKWMTEKYCIKVVSPSKWKEAFIRNSFIPIIPIDVPSVVAMPYVENQNLFDVLAGRIGDYSFSEKVLLIKKAVRLINEMHAKIVWGELIVQNMIVTEDNDIILCDTETEYYRGTIIERKASDWMDFIFSVIGAVTKVHPEKVSYLVDVIFDQIESEVKVAIKEKCRRNKNLLHKIFSFYDTARLACPPLLYEKIKKIIVSL